MQLRQKRPIQLPKQALKLLNGEKVAEEKVAKELQDAKDLLDAIKINVDGEKAKDVAGEKNVEAKDAKELQDAKDLLDVIKINVDGEKAKDVAGEKNVKVLLKKLWNFLR